jgi:hypothetical protein
VLEYGVWNEPELFSLVIVGLALSERKAIANIAGAVGELLM